MFDWLIAAFGRVGGPADPHALANQPVRRRLLGLIQDRPGLHGSELCREVQGSWGTVQYHLDLLHKADLIDTVASGRERRFFPPGTDPQKARLLAILKHGRREEIAAFIERHPGAKQVDICKGLKVSRKTFRASIDPLVEGGLIRERRGLQFNQYFPDDGLAAMADDRDL